MMIPIRWNTWRRHGWELLALKSPVCLPVASFLDFLNIALIPNKDHNSNIQPVLNILR
jgi:hypothetical protein